MSTAVEVNNPITSVEGVCAISAFLSRIRGRHDEGLMLAGRIGAGLT